MRNLSVIFNSTDKNNSFLNKLYSEISADFLADYKDGAVEISNISEEKSSILCTTIARNIISEYQKKLLVNAINKVCTFLGKTERTKVWQIAMHKLLEEEYNLSQNYLYRLESIKRKIMEYIVSSDTLSIEGFVNFRLAEYKAELEDMADEALDEFVIEEEYREFVRMLKYFVSLQTPRYMSVDVFYTDEVRIFSQDKEVTKECCIEFGDDRGPYNQFKDDFLLNSLIVIAPKKIDIYCDENVLAKEVAETIKSVFENKVEFHYGCLKNGLH